MSGTNSVQVSDYYFHLPKNRIAFYPPRQRDQARLLRLVRATGQISHHQFSDLPDLLLPKDLVVLNDTKVFPARLIGKRISKNRGQENPTAYSQAPIEVLLIKPIKDNCWETLVKPGKKIRIGDRLLFGEGRLEGKVLEQGEKGLRKIQFKCQGDFHSIIDQVGQVPLPPYINRPTEDLDWSRYQTIYAKKRGSVAAPTAGLHFTPEIFFRLKEKKITSCTVTLHIGQGTFRPISSQKLENHRLEKESFEITPPVYHSIRTARNKHQRIIAVGTTVTRTLESAFSKQGFLPSLKGETDLFIFPGFSFNCVDVLITNFHLPNSTLLMLACAFAGRDFIFQAYQEAIDKGYRFYSYGDCMLIE